VIFAVSKAVSSVPRGGVIVIATVLRQFEIPTDIIANGIGVLLGLDALLDMTRTGVNVMGNCTVAALASPLEAPNSSLIIA